MKTTHGGARKGAGRKPRATPRQAITVRLEPQDAAKMRAICQAQKLSQSAWLTKKIQDERYEQI